MAILLIAKSVFLLTIIADAFELVRDSYVAEEFAKEINKGFPLFKEQTPLISILSAPKSSPFI